MARSSTTVLKKKKKKKKIVEDENVIKSKLESEIMKDNEDQFFDSDLGIIDGDDEEFSVKE